MMRSTFSFVASMPDSRRISSSTLSERFCASSMISSTLRPAAYCSMRKLLRVAISSAFFILKGENPNCTSTDCRNSTAVTCVWLICAMTTSESSWRRKLSMSVVLPEPISPVITTKPSVNQMVDSMYALARAWARDEIQELRVRTQPERQLAQFEVLEIHRSGRYYGKPGKSAGNPWTGLPNCEPGRAIDAGK